MNWRVLGIDPTKDKKAITTAYRTRLTQVNPEDKPEEFKELRAAYEEALRLADQTEEAPVRDESPVGLWMEKVRALYADFPARIRVENWNTLLQEDVCIALDQRPLAEEALLHFFMEDYFVPQAVWQAIDSVFSLSARCEELYESYPRDFIDHAVMSGIRAPASLPYELFIPGQNAADCDEYRRLYYQSNQVAPGEMGPMLEKMAALSERHPYGEALQHRLELEQGETEKGKTGYRLLAEQYPREIPLQTGWMMLCLRDENYTEAAALARRILELEPAHYQAKRALADCLAAEGSYADAKELIYDLMHDAGGDQMQLHQLGNIMRSWNDALIQQYEEKLQKDPTDSHSALELGWCYLQNDQHDEALRAALMASPEYEDQYAYHNLHAKVRYGRGEYAFALPYLHKLEELLQVMQPDGTEETANRLRGYPKILQLIGSSMMNLDRKEEALEYYEKALAMAPENAEVLTYTARLFMAQKQFDRATEILQQLTKVLPNAYHGYLLLAMSLYELRRDRDAFDAINRALRLESSDLGVYVLKMRILLRNGVWDEVHAIIDFLREHGVTDDISVEWCEAQLTELEAKDEEKALKQYRAIAKRHEEEGSFVWAGDLYFRIAVLTGSKLNPEKEEVREALIELLDQGLAAEADHRDCLDYKAWLLKRGGNVEEALKLYHQLESMPQHSLSVEQNLADLYYRDLNHNAEKALHYYRMLLQHNENPDYYFYIGTCRRFLGQYEEAEQCFLREQELSPDDIDAFNGLSHVYEALGRYEEALAQSDKAIELVQNRDRDYSWLYGRKVQILRRLERPQEAIAAVKEAMQKYDYKAGPRLCFDICCQFGLFDEAKKLLDEWRKKDKKNGTAAASAVYLSLYTGRNLMAKMQLADSKKLLSDTSLENLQLQMAELSGDTRRVVEIWKHRAATISDKTHAMMNLSEALLFDGNPEDSKKAAESALRMLDEMLSTQHMPNEALYRSRRAMVLALLGRMEEARAELAFVRTMPLCVGCEYCSCKDADIFEATMEEICGNTEKALQFYRAGHARWPDELDFVTGELRITRKEH